MLLSGKSGDRLELDVLGYEFPESEDDEWDSNWLKIRISASNERGSWTATDPCLLTYEIEALAEWLEAMSDRNEAGPELGFTEPNLAFEFVDAGDGVRLRTWFELELRPGWAPFETAPARDVCVDLELERSDLRTAADSLRAQLRRFPPRGGGD